jgi:kynurenine formamidase
LPMSTIIDLSLPLVSFGWEPLPVKIFRYDHSEDSREVGRKKEYCHIEKMANLDKVPTKPFGFKVPCFPAKISKAGAGWCRAVAILEQ